MVAARLAAVGPARRCAAGTGRRRCARVVEGGLAGSVAHGRIGTAIDQMLHDLVPARLRCGEQRGLALVVAALNVGGEFGGVGMAVE